VLQWCNAVGTLSLVLWAFDENSTRLVTSCSLSLLIICHPFKSHDNNVNYVRRNSPPSFIVVGFICVIVVKDDRFSKMNTSKISPPVIVIFNASTVWYCYHFLVFLHIQWGLRVVWYFGPDGCLSCCPTNSQSFSWRTTGKIIRTDIFDTYAQLLSVVLTILGFHRFFCFVFHKG